jgi:hypothetical protein
MLAQSAKRLTRQPLGETIDGAYMKNIPIIRKEEYRKWVQKVSSIFDIRPRDASKSNKIWLSRDKEEKELNNALFSSGVNICIDGPTGTGKTSLALTVLGKTNIRYLPIQIVESMNWEMFCRDLIWKPQQQVDKNYSYGFEAGVDSGLPTGKFQATLERTVKSPYSGDGNIFQWDEHDLCKELDRQ